MRQEDAFLQAVLDEPDDEAPRLIYADWLQERGDPRGEFIQVQCQLARLRAGDPRRVALEVEEQELFDEYGAEWLHAVHPSLWKFDALPCGFRRGFVEQVAMSASEFLRIG